MPTPEDVARHAADVERNELAALVQMVHDKPAAWRDESGRPTIEKHGPGVDSDVASEFRDRRGQCSLSRGGE